MNKITPITPNFAVTGALRPEDFAAIRAMGFKAVISNLPDGESAAYPTAAQEAQLAEAAGLAFRHIPTTKFDVFSERVVGGMQSALSEFPGPVLAHCASGMRSAAAWAGAAAGCSPPTACSRPCSAPASTWPRCAMSCRSRAVAQHPGPIPPALDAEGARSTPPEDQSSRRTSRRTAGSSSLSNQGLAVSQPLLRQDGCGSGT